MLQKLESDFRIILCSFSILEQLQKNHRDAFVCAVYRSLHPYQAVVTATLRHANHFHIQESCAMSDTPIISWSESGENHTARWRSEAGNPPPKRVMVADDRITADAAHKLACEGTALLWRGDYQNARQLLQALARRIDRKSERKTPSAAVKTSRVNAMTQAFHLHRQAQAQRARILGMLLLPLEADYRIDLRRAPDVALACRETYGSEDGVAAVASVVSLREVLGLIGAHERVSLSSLDDPKHRENQSARQRQE